MDKVVFVLWTAPVMSKGRIFEYVLFDQDGLVVLQVDMS